MFNFESHLKITKDLILKHVSEEDIFERYLGIRPDYSQQFRNPLRRDNNPGCGFYINKHGRIKFADQGGGFDWDCFNVVEYLWSCDFKDVLKIVGRDYGFFSDGLPKSDPTRQRVLKEQEKKEIRIERRRDYKGRILWLEEDKEFWYDRYYLTRQDLDIDTSPVSKAWYLRPNGHLEQFYFYKPGDPCYAYYFGAHNYQLYFPKREKGYKFRQSIGDIIFGYNQLPQTGHILIITKSMKDVKCINKMGKDIGMYAVGMMSETQMIPEDVLKDLLLRFDYVFTLFDFDRAGIRLARKYEKKYNIPFLFFGKEYRGRLFLRGFECIKDFSDHLWIRRWDATNELIKMIYNERIG